MYKLICLLSVALLSGCVLYVEPSRSGVVANDEGLYYGDVWLDAPYVSCTYDAYWDLSEWYLEIYATSYYGPYEIYAVGFYINNHDYQEMDYVGDGYWGRSIVSNYYDCDRALHFDFVAVDYDGYEGYYAYHW